MLAKHKCQSIPTIPTLFSSLYAKSGIPGYQSTIWGLLKNGLHEVWLKIGQTKKETSPGMNYFEEMVLNGVLEILHSEFMIQHVCDGKALRNKLGDSDEKHPDQI